MLHAEDRRWVMRPDDLIEFWEGDQRSLADDLTLVRCGGHYDGSTALHWGGGADGQGVLLSSDTLHVTLDRQWVSFMYSFPNLIPLPPTSVEHIVTALAPFTFETIVGGWLNRNILTNGKEVVSRSAERYLAAISDSQTSS